jgi:hypothetical protein
MGRRMRLVALIGAVVLVSSGCDWLQWGGGATHRGTIYEPVLNKTNVAGLVPSTMATIPTTSPAVTSNGLVFVESAGLLTAFDAKTSAVVWSASLPAGSTEGGTPAIHQASNTIFVVVAGASPVLVGFDVSGVRNCNPLLDTCRPVFSAQLGNAFGPSSPPVVDGAKVFANGANTLFAFDATGQTNCTSSSGQATCTPLWSAATGFAAGGVAPAVADGVVYDAIRTGGTFALGAFSKSSGSPLWTGSLGASPVTASPSIGADGSVFVPAGQAIDVFAGDGCGSPTCPPSFALVARSGDPLGGFLATPAIDGPNLYATNRNGLLYAWPSSACGTPTCQPSLALPVDAPAGGSPAYSQSPVIANGILFLLTRQVVGSATHAVLLARNEADLTPLKSWDLGSGGLGAGLANVSVAESVVYASVANALVAVHAPPVEPLASLSTSPLALSPAFSPSTFDYVLRCAQGSNSVTFTMSAVPGGTVALVAPTTTQPSQSQTATVSLNENQAAVVEASNAGGATARYWIRCLPHDFPPLAATPHPAAGTPSPGWYLVGNNITPAGTPSYAMILDSHGTPVWYKRAALAALNITPLGHDSVAFMSTLALVGFGADPNGHYDAYSLDTGGSTTIRTVGVPTDLHELYAPSNGHHLLLSYPLKRGVDLTGLQSTPTPGPNSTIADCVVQDIDPQGGLVWQWTASDHIDPVTESTTAPSVNLNGETVYDVYHCNSIDEGATGDLLVSARHLNAVFEIRRSDGRVVWKLGGKPVNKDGAAIIAIQNDPAGGMVMQHDARYLPNGHVSVFDNRSPQAAVPARGVEYALDLVSKTAHPVFSFSSPDNAPSCCMGSFRRYPDGHSVIGWGYVTVSNGSVFTEINASGQAVFDVRFASAYASYRSVKVPPPRFDVNVLRATAGQ